MLLTVWFESRLRRGLAHVVRDDDPVTTGVANFHAFDLQPVLFVLVIVLGRESLVQGHVTTVALPNDLGFRICLYRRLPDHRFADRRNQVSEFLDYRYDAKIQIAL